MTVVGGCTQSPAPGLGRTRRREGPDRPERQGVGGPVAYWLGLSFVKCSRLLACLGTNAIAGMLYSVTQTTGNALVRGQHDLVAEGYMAPVLGSGVTSRKVSFTLGFGPNPPSVVGITGVSPRLDH